MSFKKSLLILRNKELDRNIKRMCITHNYSGNQIEKHEMGGARITYGGKGRCIQDFGGETWGKATTWETQA
jgi:hypothetical protein